MQPAEELFNTGEDHLEMENLAANPDYSGKLDEMRSLYEEHYNRLVSNVIDYNNYEKYKVLFNKNATPEEKKPFLKGTYKKELKLGMHKGYKIR
jgi:hypothetical protein